ncbi:MAG: carboxypeptidase-like regulatory domain-containing protein, partial [Bacteroidota bacterium]
AYAMAFQLCPSGSRRFVLKLAQDYSVDWIRPLQRFNGVNFEAISPSYLDALYEDAFYAVSKDTETNQTYLQKFSSSLNGFYILGTVFGENDNDCSIQGPTPTPAAETLVLIENVATQQVYSTLTDKDGRFTVPVDSGDYTVNVFHNLPYWENCTSAEDTITTTAQYTFVKEELTQTIECIDLETDISTSQFIRCFDGNYIYVRVCNRGNLEAEDAEVVLRIDTFLNIIEATSPYTLVDQNVLNFDLGDLDINECFGFKIEVEVDCDSELGQTHCINATAYPNEPCTVPSDLWDGSSVEVDGSCLGDGVQFELSNAGNNNMSSSLNYTIIRDATIHETGTFQLNSGAEQVFDLPADGSTWRMEAEQAEYHPISNRPSLSIEGCSENGGPFTVGFVNQFPPDDLQNHIDIDCERNRGSYDPNDKLAEPVGYSDAHYIEANTELEYTVRFQNTGTAPAVNIIIRDTLSDQLDLTSFRLIQSSHPYDDVHRWSSPGILKPDRIF